MNAAETRRIIAGFHLDLAPGWSLRADPLQWMICRERFRRGVITWQPVSFIASNKRMLASAIARAGLFNRPDLYPAVHAFLSASPHSFREWVQLSTKSDREGAQ